MSELFGTTAFRLAVLFSAGFGALTVAMFVLVHVVSASFVESRTTERLDHELNSLIGTYVTHGIDGLVEVVQERSAEAGLANLYYLLQDSAGALVAGNLKRWPADVAVGERDIRFRRSVELRDTGFLSWDPDESYQVAASTAEIMSGYRLLVGIGLYEYSELRERTLGGLMLGAVGTVLLALLAGVLLGRTMLSRVQKIDVALGEIMAGNLSRRIDPGDRHDEFSRLATRINGTLDQIEKLVTSLRSVTNNVSHDLRTPLHRLRSRLEQLVISTDLSHDKAQQVQSGIHDIEEILTTFEDLLAISEAGAGAQLGDMEDVDLAQMVENVAELYGAPAEEHDLSFDWTVERPAWVRGKANLISRALSNLLDNAIKFTPAGGKVSIRLSQERDGLSLCVADTGPGIPESERSRVLEPFERLDSARSSPGSGLGLSVVQAIAELHGAELRLENGAPGLKVSMRFLKSN